MLSFKIIPNEVEEMCLWFRAVAALVEDLGWMLSTLIWPPEDPGVNVVYKHT